MEEAFLWHLCDTTRSAEVPSEMLLALCSFPQRHLLIASEGLGILQGENPVPERPEHSLPTAQPPFAPRTKENALC